MSHSTALPQYHLPSPPNHRDRQLETLLEIKHDDMAQGFCPKTLRLSHSFPSTGHLRHPSSTLSVTRWKEGLAQATSSHEDELLPTHDHQSKNIMTSLTFRPSSQRLRTRSLDRKSNPVLNLPPANLAPHKKSYIRRKASSSHNSLSDPSSLPNDSSAQRHSLGFHSHIPIERTVLSVLPSSRRPSIDWSVPAPPEANAATFESSPSATSSGSPKTTLATSVDSSGTPPRPRYQPRPLLLSAFGANNKNRTSIGPSTYPYQARDSPVTREQQELAKTRWLAEVQRDKVQQLRQERLHNREAKKLRKQAREAELVALSSSVRCEGTTSAVVPEADEDNWSWLSCSDAAEEEESADDQEAEEMAVVWRASLDVGRRVSKSRKALGRGHGIPLPPSRLTTTNPRPPQCSLPVSSLSPLKLFRMLLFSQKRDSIVPPKLVAPFLFSSGMLSGLACSLLFSSSFNLSSLLSHGHLLPISTSGIAFFFNLVLPSPLSSFGSIATSIGLSAHWCMSHLVRLVFLIHADR